MAFTNVPAGPAEGDNVRGAEGRAKRGFRRKKNPPMAQTATPAARSCGLMPGGARQRLYSFEERDAFRLN